MFVQFGEDTMDFDLAISRQRDALVRIVASLFAMLGLADEVLAGRIPRGLHSAVLRILRPAESAVRRLIVAAARGMVAEPKAPRAARKGSTPPKGTAKRGARTPAFNLSDKHEPWLPPRHKRKPRSPGPRITIFDGPEPTVASMSAYWAAQHQAELRAAGYTPPPPAPEAQPEPELNSEDDGCVTATRLSKRLFAIRGALADINRQARRLVQWKATRERRADAGKLVHTSPLREGDPPGFREKITHDVDRILDECIWIAFEATRQPRPIDSS
ncbi:MAG: hypothetical protein HC855_14475 [Rhizobiales bacterium]|nr:hypothetical protein [Hyphomicrobiales bacterium]